MIAQLRRRGYHFVTVSTLLGLPGSHPAYAPETPPSRDGFTQSLLTSSSMMSNPFRIWMTGFAGCLLGAALYIALLAGGITTAQRFIVHEGIVRARDRPSASRGPSHRVVDRLPFLGQALRFPRDCIPAFMRWFRAGPASIFTVNSAAGRRWSA